MTETDPSQLALCRLILVRDHWIPLSWNATLTTEHRSSPNGPIISAQLIAEVKGEQIVGWRQTSFDVAEIREDGSVDTYNPQDIAAALAAGHSDATAQAAGVIGISHLLMERRRDEKVSQVPEQLRKAAFERASWQIGDRLRGWKAVGVTLVPA